MTANMAAATAISQLGCFSAVHRSIHLRRRHSLLFPSPRSKLSVVMSLERHDTDTAGTDTKNTLSYAADVSKLHVEEKQNSYSTKEDHDTEKTGFGQAIPESIDQPKKTAKIHDFCLGIPFGAISDLVSHEQKVLIIAAGAAAFCSGFVLTGGIVGFIFSRSPATLSSGVLFGGALLFLSTFSLKVWRQGKSSLPFILGQAALAGILIWKNFQSYSLAKKIFPTGFSAIISSAMLCFYLYVLISGGNPPPKKLKPSASTA